MKLRSPISLVAVVVTLALGCGPEGEVPEGLDTEQAGEGDLLGRATLALSTVPAAIRCVSVVATGEDATVTRNFTVTAGTEASTLDLGRLPLGDVSFQGRAFDRGCSNIATATPLWIADPVTILLAPGFISSLELTFRPNNSIEGSATFVDNIVQLSTGPFTTFAVMSDGTVLEWGSRYVNGGDMTMPSAVPGLTGVTQVAAGTDHACAVHFDGSVSCWGGNLEGQLGRGGGPDSVRTAPAKVNGLIGAVRQISAGGASTCAVLIGDNVQCWGSNRYRQLTTVGVDEFFDTSDRIIARRVQSVHLGADFRCLLGTDLRVSCMGRDLGGVLGDAPASPDMPNSIPSAILPLASMSTGEHHSCGVRPDGTVWCWGAGYAGQIGDGATVVKRLPTRVVGIASAETVVTGADFSCAILRGGAIQCWGDGERLTTGTGTNSAVPVAVPGLKEVVELAAGYYHACARTRSSKVYCWGANGVGQLGNGTKTTSLAPVEVSF